MLRKMLALALLLPQLVTAQGSQSTVRPIMALYDLDSATETFCAFDPSLSPDNGNVITAGSSATITSVAGTTTTPFLNVAVMDQILIGGSAGSAAATRTVLERASSTSVTLSSAIDVSSPTTGRTLQHRTLRCSTDGTAGAFSVSGYDSLVIDFTIQNQNTTTGIDVRLQCRVADSNARWQQVFPVLVPPAVTATYTTYTGDAEGLAYEFPPLSKWDQCRLGIKLNTTDDGGDTGTDQEQVSATMQYQRHP